MKLTKKQQERLTNIKDRDELLSVLKEYGFNGSFEDVENMLNKQGKVELSDEDLENVSGGIDVAYLLRLALKEYGIPALEKIFNSNSKDKD